MDLFAKSFLKELRRIAYKTNGEMTAEDLQNEAWLVARYIEEKRGHEVDLTDPFDQDLVLSVLYVQNVKRKAGIDRYAVRINHGHEDDEGGITTMVDRLPAIASSDPLESLLMREANEEEALLLASSYSQAAAYVAVFYCFNQDRQGICAYLIISDNTLTRRVDVAAATVEVQPSLFDRVERISKDFMPLPGRQYAATVEHHCSANQWAWEF